LCCFEHTGDLADISEAISSHQKAVQLTPEGHADMHSQLNSLGASFMRRFEYTRDLTDISEAISFQQKSVQLTPEDHPNMHINTWAILEVHSCAALDTQEISLTSQKQYHSTREQFNSLLRAMQTCVVG
jgi:hypothetical protein